ncbi:Hypothetical protein SRAE_2000065800 [Strongyloides ratti]|uniref:Uncharacterized protein n=1 Tax=Strongyloides ratti TaxID=34506 RepID=A0A090MXT3_STRRB|nr:Hypothetical protein SRAE_2000065800 [Strongyloides ratti]CEF65984.1 Hypothetical protein SRAE_2000065800 [Strongyloides ratti]
MFYGNYGGYGGGMYGGGGCSYGYGYGCGLFDWDVSYWIYIITGLIIFFLIICLLCSPCLCTAFAACLAGMGLNTKKGSKNKNQPIQQVPPQPPTIITTHPIVTTNPTQPGIITHQPAPLEQKNITIYENSDKPIPKGRKKKDYDNGPEILSEDRYYSLKRQRLPRTSPYVDRILYTQQNERYYGDRR